MNWLSTLGKLAPTVASALGGPLAGVAVTALGELFGINEPTQDKIKVAIENGSMTGEQISAIRQLEMKLKNDEAERGFKYAELEFKDRDSARKANVEGGTANKLFWMSLVLLVITLGSELVVLFNGYPKALPEIIVGRILGLMDSVALMVLAYWYGTTNGSARKTDMLNQSK
jgi:hypothetical protein